MDKIKIQTYPERLLFPDRQPEIPNFFNVRDDHKTAIFVDGPNIGISGKISGTRLNYENLRWMFEQHSDLVSANYYTPMFRADDGGATPIKSFLEYLSHSHWNVVVREGYTSNSGKYRAYEIDVLMAHHIHLLAASKKVDTILIVANDRDYAPTAQVCKQHYGVRFFHLYWTTQSDASYTIANHMLRLECEVSLDVAMPELSEYLIFDENDRERLKKEYEAKEIDE